jgi:hypothetical protein
MTGRLRPALTLSVMLAVFTASLFWTQGSLARLPDRPRVSDPEIYDRILYRLGAGEPYYVVVGSELRANGFATQEVFNWRTPLLWRTLAPLRPWVRRVLLSALGVAFAVVAALVAAGTSRASAVVTAVMSIGVAVLMSAPGAVAMGEAWAGGLIGLSVCAYARGRSWAGLGLGLLAMFVRELVAPYAVLATFIAAARRRWLEAGAWLVGGLAYGAYYGVHLTHVLAQRSPLDAPGQGSWLAFGGLTFLLSAVQWNALLFFAPWPLVCLSLALIVGAILNPRCPLHARWATAVYAIFFLVVGQHFDRYWGYLTWPVWALACGSGADLVLTSSRALMKSSVGQAAVR